LKIQNHKTLFRQSGRAAYLLFSLQSPAKFYLLTVILLCHDKVPIATNYRSSNRDTTVAYLQN